MDVSLPENDGMDIAESAMAKTFEDPEDMHISVIVESGEDIHLTSNTLRTMPFDQLIEFIVAERIPLKYWLEIAVCT